MRAYLSRRYHFSASHRLHVDAFSAEVNQVVFGKCNNPHGHGHNYTVEVCFSGPIDPATGMVTNLADLDRWSQERLFQRFDMTNLNMLDLFQTLVPTTENLAVILYKIYADYPHARLEGVHVEETPNNSFDYTGPAAMEGKAR